jgi:hypothetical protein
VRSWAFEASPPTCQHASSSRAPHGITSKHVALSGSRPEVRRAEVRHGSLSGLGWGDYLRHGSRRLGSARRCALSEMTEIS